MRRKDRARDPAFAWLVFDQAAYGVLSMRDEGGGYGVPVSPARIGEKIYFHCAMEGKKVDCLSRWPSVSLTVAEAGETDYFSVCYRSAIFRGTAAVVVHESEKRAALAAITQRYCPQLEAELDSYLAGHLSVTCVFRLDVEEVTGKERQKG